MSNHFIPRPVVQCTDCQKISRSIARIDQNCYELIDGKPCQGVFRSTGETDWTLCEPCQGVGLFQTNRTCLSCYGNGWINTGSLQKRLTNNQDSDIKEPR